MKDSEIEWFRPLWLRVLITAAITVWFGYEVGHSGGALVYEHGAASAYATPDPAAAEGGDEDEAGDEDADDEDEDEDEDD